MSGAQVSIVISAGRAAQRLRLSLQSAIAAGEVGGVPFEVIVALADADAPTQEVADALSHPRLRLSTASAATTTSAAEMAWGETVVVMEGADLLSPHYVQASLATLARDAGAPLLVARPECCIAYGGTPGLRMQQDLADDATGRARLVFGAPFAPPLTAARSLLLRLPPRAWSLDADWAWTAGSLAAGARHAVVPTAVYIAWTEPVVAAIHLPARGHPGVAPPTEAAQSSAASLPASEAEVAAVLYARSAHARLGGLEEAARTEAARLTAMTAEIHRLNAALRSAQTEAEDAALAAQAMRASSSWRMTAPLRALSSRLKPKADR